MQGQNDSRILAMLAEMFYNGGNFEKAADFAEQAVLRANCSPLASIGGMYAGVHKSTLVQARSQHGRALQHLHKFDATDEVFGKFLSSHGSEFVSLNLGFYFRFGTLKLEAGRQKDDKVDEKYLQKVMDNATEKSYRALRGFLGRRFRRDCTDTPVRNGHRWRRARIHYRPRARST